MHPPRGRKKKTFTVYIIIFEVPTGALSSSYSDVEAVKKIKIFHNTDDNIESFREQSIEHLGA